MQEVECDCGSTDTRDVGNGMRKCRECGEYFEMIEPTANQRERPVKRFDDDDRV